ncbi:MAG TPA: phosphoribosyltransferase family protein [Candidatus Cybelea sp.]|jgi:orotate phosphoribosyltransferase|nr:phosphoribosyltransferase family protein [Candidatus Cybelea sp.]
MEHLGLQDLAWLRKTIVERALTRGEYVLSGGVRSDYYIDKFRLFSDPHVLRRIARMFTPVITETNPDLVGGTELGGVVIATAVSQLSGVPMIAVRKKPKAYGAFPDEYVEGPYHAGQRVLLLEDVVTSGSELLAAVSRLQELGLTVTPYAVVSRGLAPVRALIGFSLPRTQPKTDN